MFTHSNTFVTVNEKPQQMQQPDDTDLRKVPVIEYDVEKSTYFNL